MGCIKLDRRALPLAVLAVFLLAGCGLFRTHNIAQPPEEQTYGPRYWFEARLGDQPNQVIITFTAPDPSGGSGCVETYEPEVRPDSSSGMTQIFLKALTPLADDSCPTKQVDLAVEVGSEIELTEGAMIGSGYTGYEYTLVGDQFELVPESTPCGRADCSTESPAPAPCDSDAFRTALAAQIDGNTRLAGEQQCDGSFLVTGIDTGSKGCAPSEGGPSPCANHKSAYFVARDGAWALVTYAKGLTCRDVEESSNIRFPESMCDAATPLKRG